MFLSPHFYQAMCYAIMLWVSMLSATAALAMDGGRPDKETLALLKQTIEEADSFTNQYDAAVWLVDMSQRLSRYVKDEQERLHILKVVHREATRFKLHPEIVLAVIHVESLFNRFAVSRVGARGIMQVMPFWKKEIGKETDNLMDLETNIRYGCTVLATYLKREKGVYHTALARYNGSVGKTWYSERVMDRWKRYWYVQN